MKTISIKLPEQEAEALDAYILQKQYPSKSEFIRNLIIERLDSTQKEKYGWLLLAQQSMAKIWDNEKDETIWQQYL